MYRSPSPLPPIVLCNSSWLYGITIDCCIHDSTRRPFVLSGLHVGFHGCQIYIGSMGTDITAAENLRLKQIIEDQQRQIDAMVVGAGRAQPTPLPAVAQGPVFATDAQMATAKPTPTRDPRLSMLKTAA